jgi:hypothetical protein
MIRFRFLASVLLLSLAATSFGYAQNNLDKSKDKDKQGKQAGPVKQPLKQVEQRGQQGQRPQKPGDSGKSLGQQKQMELSPEQRRAQQRKQESAWQERRANHWQYEHRNWQQRGGYKGDRIPEDYFRDHFGDTHAFRIYGLPFMYEAGNPRFQYDGYWFTLLDPYPEDWGGRWYETDDVYVAYRGDGYYLFNRRNPNPAGIALSVSF